MDPLMFIVAGPAGTGGIKITTFAVLFFIILTELCGEAAMNIFGKRLSRSVHRQAITVALVAVAAVFSGTMVLLAITDFSFEECLFEATSAFATVGLSTGVKPELPATSELVLIALMYLAASGSCPWARRSPCAIRKQFSNFQKKGKQLVNFSGGRGTAKKIAHVNSVAVVGLGRFGASLALELMSSGTSVLGIDHDADIVPALNGGLTQVVRADATKREALEQLSLNEFDRVVVAIGNHLQASILTCSKLLSMGIPHVWVKSQDDQHGLILEQLGVHHIIYPEKEMGRRVAHLVRGSMVDYLEIDRGFAMVKTTAPKVLQGLKLGDSNLRKRYGVTVAARTNDDGRWQHADVQTVLKPGVSILVLGPIVDTEAFGQLPD